VSHTFRTTRVPLCSYPREAGGRTEEYRGIEQCSISNRWLLQCLSQGDHLLILIRMYASGVSLLASLVRATHSHEPSSRTTCTKSPTLLLANASKRHIVAPIRLASASAQGTLSGALGGQLSVGSILGFATGYACKRIGQLLLVIVGIEVVTLQLMARKGWVRVNWRAIERDLAPHVERDGFERVIEEIKYKVPFAGAFTAGMYAGVRWT
jgi:uncharacterized membrane protein (Fun14 family)